MLFGTEKAPAQWKELSSARPPKIGKLENRENLKMSEQSKKSQKRPEQSGNVKKMTEQVWNTSRTSPEHVRKLSGEILEKVKNMLGISPEQVQRAFLLAVTDAVPFPEFSIPICFSGVCVALETRFHL